MLYEVTNISQMYCFNLESTPRHFALELLNQLKYITIQASMQTPKYRTLSSERSPVSPSLGLEKYVSTAFSQTVSTITNLGNDLEKITKNNESLKEKMNDLIRQRETLILSNEKLERDLEAINRENEAIFDERNRKKVQLIELKKQIESINDEWEGKKKILEQEIFELNEVRKKAQEEQDKEEMAAEQQKKLLKKQVDNLKADISKNKLEITRLRMNIKFMAKKEQTSMEGVAMETMKFKEFLDKVNNGEV